MKTKTITTLLLGIVASLCLATQCEKEEFTDRLPPETQEGKNTFGCYVNGELFVKSKGSPMGNKPLSAWYGMKSKRLDIECRAANPAFFSMDFLIYNPREGNNILTIGHFSPKVPRDCCFGCENCGKIFITKFDTINCIVSGTFEFSGRCTGEFSSYKPMEYTGDSIVHITDGRFDIPLNLNPNQ